MGLGLGKGWVRVMGGGDGMERGGRERDILGNSKLTVCHEAAGYVKGLVVGKRVSVRVTVGVWDRG